MIFRRRRAEPSAASAPSAPSAPSPEPALPVRGPFDVSDVPELGDRLDLGSLRVPRNPGVQVRLELERTSRQAVAVSLSHEGSALQLQVFAAPRSANLWDELREEIATSVRQQRGTVDDVRGAFGRELVAHLPVAGKDGRAEQRPARFAGVDGPRWFLRGVFTGRAALEEQAAGPLEELLADVVVVRGAEPRAPRDVLLLHPPGQPSPATSLPETEDVLGRGPEITETR